jgi:hypothetical protein
MAQPFGLADRNIESERVAMRSVRKICRTLHSADCAIEKEMLAGTA